MAGDMENGSEDLFGEAQEGEGEGLPVEHDCEADVEAETTLLKTHKVEVT